MQAFSFRILGVGLCVLSLSITNVKAAPQSCAEGDQLLGKAKYSQAVKAYNTCLNQAPDHINAYFNRAGAYTGLKQYTQAIADYDKVLERLPLDSEAYYNRGSLYRLLKNKIQSIEDFRIATELNPESKKYQEALIAAYVSAQETQKALDHLSALIEKEARVEWYVQRGALYKDMGSFSKALHDFGKALNKDATHTEAWFQRGLTYFKSKQYPQAIYDLSQAIKNNPKMPLAYYNRGLAYQNQNKCALAQQDFRRACQLGDKVACQHKCQP